MLQNASNGGVTFSGENFAVAAELTCLTNQTGFPGKSFLATQFQLDLSLNISDGRLNLTQLLAHGAIEGGANLPKNFAEKENTLDSGKTVSFVSDGCEQPIAVIFHAFNNSKLFQSATSDGQNLELPSNELTLGSDLSVVNTVVVSATLTAGLNTEKLKDDAELLFNEFVPIVSVFSLTLSDVRKNKTHKKALCITSIGYVHRPVSAILVSMSYQSLFFSWPPVFPIKALFSPPHSIPCTYAFLLSRRVAHIGSKVRTNPPSFAKFHFFSCSLYERALSCHHTTSLQLKQRNLVEREVDCQRVHNSRAMGVGTTLTEV